MILSLESESVFLLLWGEGWFSDPVFCYYVDCWTVYNRFMIKFSVGTHNFFFLFLLTPLIITDYKISHFWLCLNSSLFLFPQIQGLIYQLVMDFLIKSDATNIMISMDPNWITVSVMNQNVTLLWASPEVYHSLPSYMFLTYWMHYYKKSSVISFTFM